MKRIFTWADFDEFFETIDDVLYNDSKSVVEYLKYRTTSDDKAYTLKVEVPGFGPEDVSVEFEAKHLVVKFGDKFKKFKVPQNVDVEGTTATVKNGLLEIILPKKEVKTNTVKVTVK